MYTCFKAIPVGTEYDNGIIFSLTNNAGGSLFMATRDLCEEPSKQNKYELLLNDHDEMDYYDDKGNCLVLVKQFLCTDKNAKNTSIPFGQITAMANGKRTPFFIENIVIDEEGTVRFDFEPANPRRSNAGSDSSYYIHAKDEGFFKIIVETRSDGFAMTRCAIVRTREKGETETKIRVTIRDSGFLRHLVYTFPDDGEPSCIVAEARR